MVRDGEVQTVQFESIIVKLPYIVRDYNLRNSILTNDVLPYKISSVLLGDLGERFCFYPFCEVVYDDDQEFSLQWSLWQRSEHVIPPLNKWS